MPRAPKDFTLNKRHDVLIQNLDTAIKDKEANRKVVQKHLPAIMQAMLDRAIGIWVEKEDDRTGREGMTRIYQMPPEPRAVAELRRMGMIEVGEAANTIAAVAKAQKDLEFVAACIAEAQAGFIRAQTNSLDTYTKHWDLSHMSEEDVASLVQSVQSAQMKPIIQMSPENFGDIYTHGWEQADRDMILAKYPPSNQFEHYKQAILDPLKDATKQAFQKFIMEKQGDEDELDYDPDLEEEDPELKAQFDAMKFEE